MTNLRSVTVKFPPELFQQIKIISEKRGETISDTVRYLITRGLDERVAQENAELIARIVREQMEQVLVNHQYAEPHRHNKAAEVDPRRLALCRKIS